eukprot:CAMPEP_0181296916 /NCGR_PEP_ID=MMETSP1101-20121128/4957_1 /TAXON_ID=46948 /ORGANISM="Rhodomonas abbreviata, Strain Caron Lab Isolate" /LENGTH=136 /DNA_ID=CAMNT_0023401809 /DNA_START=151 /DNA_END=561 /DNA_ORIENTATION=+
MIETDSWTEQWGMVLVDALAEAVACNCMAEVSLMKQNKSKEQAEEWASRRTVAMDKSQLLLWGNAGMHGNARDSPEFPESSQAFTSSQASTSSEASRESSTFPDSEDVESEIVKRFQFDSSPPPLRHPNRRRVFDF